MSNQDALDKILIALKLIFPDDLITIMEIIIVEAPSLID